MAEKQNLCWRDCVHATGSHVTSCSECVKFVTLCVVVAVEVLVPVSHCC